MVKLTRIYTRGGDKGQTSLNDGSRVPKHDARVSAYGDVDEANACIGLARVHAEGEIDAENLEIECWKHGSCFSLVDGEPSSLPATRPVPVWDVKIDGDDVYVVLT